MNNVAETIVVNKDQGDLIDQSKALLVAHATTEKNADVLLFALGGRLRLLKATCNGHGHFEKVKAENFPDVQRSKLGRALTYFDAVQYLARGKYPTVGFLGQGELQLTNGDLSDKDKSKAAVELEQITKGHGVMKTIARYLKKTATKPEPVDALKREEEHQKNIVSMFADAVAALDRVLGLKDADFALGGKELRAALAGRCVRFGKLNRKLKAFKPKAAK